MKNTFLSILLLISLSSFGQVKTVNFTPVFKKENQGKYKVEVNDVKELLLIMMSITDFGLGNDDMFNQKGQYYQDVLLHFQPYKNEPIIKKMDSLLIKSPLNYIFISGNGQTYEFDGDTLKSSTTYLLTADEVADVKIQENPLIALKNDLEQFARKSGYLEFKKKQQPFYDSIIASYEKSANLGKQWKWLEKNFSTKIDSYVIYTSPLINGLNYTANYNNNGFRLIEMILPPLTASKNRSEQSTEAFNTRVMFTEIDHNYVGPPSKTYEKEINEALKNREKWVNTKVYGTEYYGDGKQVFNEYMTFGVFILYAEEIYKDNPELLKEINNEVIAVMKDRGFIKMKEFTDELKRLHGQNKKAKIDRLFPKLVKWCETI